MFLKIYQKSVDIHFVILYYEYIESACSIIFGIQK